MVSDPRAVNSLVAFRNSQGSDARGTLLKLTRTTLIFEVYNPYSIVQLSEVLRDVQIRRGERIIYRGRAVVTSLVNTGLMLIVSATLTDAWSDLSGVVANGSMIRKEVQEFVEDWDVSSRLRPGYQLIVGRLRSFLTELNRWLEQLDVERDESDVGYGAVPDEELFANVTGPVFPRLDELFQEFEDEAAHVPQDEVVNHKRFVQSDLHPLILRAPFVHRALYKPLGYAGDYEMVNMMLGRSDDGPTMYSRVINAAHLAAGPAAAHRNRIDILVSWLAEAIHKAESNSRSLTCLNVGCGPAIELQRITRSHPSAGRCRFELMDFSEETLRYTQGKLQESTNESGIQPDYSFIHESVHNLLKKASKARDMATGQNYDIVYCAGLFDYLSDKVCSRLLHLFYQWVCPGGRVLVTNVHPANDAVYRMEHILEWYLIYRDEERMRSLVPQEWIKSVYVDKTGINVFMELQKVER